LRTASARVGRVSSNSVAASGLEDSISTGWEGEH